MSFTQNYTMTSFCGVVADWFWWEYLRLCHQSVVKNKNTVCHLYLRYSLEGTQTAFVKSNVFSAQRSRRSVRVESRVDLDDRLNAAARISHQNIV